MDRPLGGRIGTTICRMGHAGHHLSVAGGPTAADVTATARLPPSPPRLIRDFVGDTPAATPTNSLINGKGQLSGAEGVCT